MERGTVEWNSGMVERVILYQTNGACALAIDVENMGWSGYQATCY